MREGSVSGARKGKTLKKSYGRGRGSNNFNTSNDNIKISLQIAATPPSTLSNATQRSNSNGVKEWSTKFCSGLAGLPL